LRVVWQPVLRRLAATAAPRVVTLLLMGVTLFASSNVRAGSLAVSLQCRPAGGCAPRGAVLLRYPKTGGVARRIDVARWPLPIEEVTAGEWDVALESTGFWALPQHVVVPASGVPVPIVLPVWRTGTLQVQLALDAPVPTPPPVVRVTVTSRPDPRQAPEIPRETSFDCAAAGKDAWTCTLPASMLDVAIRVTGYAPHHIWDLKVEPGRTTNRGPIRIQKGASLLAWLDNDFARRVTVPVRAVVRYETAAPSQTLTSMRLRAPVTEGVFNKKGVVLLSPLPAGRYILEAQAKGYAPLEIPAQLFEGRETTPRRSIELSPAVKVRLLLQPALGPGGTPWRIELWRVSPAGPSQDAGSGVASIDGVFDAQDQAEGPLRVLIKDASNNILANETIVVTPALSDYPIKVDVEAVTGKVTIGDSPLASARLLFGGSGGKEKIRAVADADGRFAVTLPRPGKWIVDVTAAAEGVATSVTTEVDHGETVVRVAATEVSGSVRDAKGKLVPGATVTLLSGGRPMTRTTDESGAFRFRGTPSGPISLYATAPASHDYTPQLRLTLPEDGRLSNIELSLQAVRALTGTIRSRGDVVVGALVHGYAVLGGSAKREEATSDLQGQFSINVPDGAAEVLLVIGSPGRTLQTFSVPAAISSAELQLAPAGGTLHLKWSPGVTPLSATFNDQFEPATELFAWARSQGATAGAGTADIPNVAPGKYRFCSAAHCAEGTLAVGGQLDLDATQ
jgi:hypothetical protein